MKEIQSLCESASIVNCMDFAKKSTEIYNLTADIFWVSGTCGNFGGGNKPTTVLKFKTQLKRNTGRLRKQQNGATAKAKAIKNERQSNMSNIAAVGVAGRLITGGLPHGFNVGDIRQASNGAQYDLSTGLRRRAWSFVSGE